MKIAVVFDTPHAGWEDEDFKAEVAARVQEAEYEVAEALMACDHEVLMVGVYDDVHAMLQQLRGFGPDLVFNCAEGFRGRSRLDYLFPALLESENHRYTGSPAIALLTTRNKAISKKILAYHGVRVPRFVTYGRGERITEPPPDLCFPLIVKPLEEDASEGIALASVVSDAAGLAERVEFIHGRFAQAALVEEYIEGRELYVGVLGNGDALEILPVIELVFDKRPTRPEERIATKSAKWDAAYRERRGIRSVFARPISRRADLRIAEACRAAFHTLWLRDYARLDVRLTPDGEVYVIEVNANPFISFGHEMASAAQKVGTDYYGFIQRIVDEALKRYEHRS